MSLRVISPGDFHEAMLALFNKNKNIVSFKYHKEIKTTMA